MAKKPEHIIRSVIVTEWSGATQRTGVSPQLPGGGGQGDEQSLQDSSDIDNGTLLGDEEVHGWQDEEAVEHQTHYHRNGVKAQLLSHGGGVVHLQDLTGYQEHNPKGEVPAEQSSFNFVEVMTAVHQ